MNDGLVIASYIRLLAIGYPSSSNAWTSIGYAYYRQGKERIVSL